MDMIGYVYIKAKYLRVAAESLRKAARKVDAEYAALERMTYDNYLSEFKPGWFFNKEPFSFSDFLAKHVNWDSDKYRFLFYEGMNASNKQNNLEDAAEALEAMVQCSSRNDILVSAETCKLILEYNNGFLG